MSDPLELLLDLHVGGERQGPGSDAATRRALTLSGLTGRSGLAVADVGCGTGASTLVLAEELDASITAVDLLEPLLQVLDERARRAGVADRIMTLAASMDALPFEQGSLDAIWSEGAIYSMGFERGVRAWRSFLRPGGVLAVSEITWLTGERPAELTAHWAGEYPEVGTASAKMAVLEAAGYSPIGYFPLPPSCWVEHYYEPLQDRFDAFLDRHGHSAEARAIVEAEQREIDLYVRFGSFFSYGFCLATRTED